MKKIRKKIIAITTSIILTTSIMCALDNKVIVNALEEKIIDENKVVDVVDKNLEKIIKEGLDIGNRNITIKDMQGIGRISTGDEEISSLEGLQYCENLNSLDIGNGSFSDLSPISSLKNLENLIFEKSNVRDLSPISNLKELRSLNICDSKVTDLSPIYSLNNLETLICRNLNLRNYDSISSLSKLEYLELNNCNIVDISSILKNTNINFLDLPNNYISNISGIENFKNLSRLNLTNNELKDISPLRKIAKKDANDECKIILERNLVGNDTDNESESIIEGLSSKGYDVENDSSKNDMHLVKVNGKRFDSNQEYGLNTKNEVKLEFSKNIKALDNINKLESYNIKDFNVSYYDDTLVIHVNEYEDREESGLFWIDESCIEGINYTSLGLLPFDEKEKDEEQEQPEKVKIPGDLNNDGVVDIKDVSIVANNYNKIKSQSSDWEEDIDCVKDGIIDIYDITFISSKLQ